MKKLFSQSLALAIGVALVMQLAACGTLMYPERRGQKAGEIDIKVAVFDGLGLLFGIIPGVVAYVVDFSTGAIYLPAGRHNTVLLGEQGLTMVRVDPELLKDPETVKQIISREMQLPVTIDWSRLETAKITKDQIGPRLAEAQATGYHN